VAPLIVCGGHERTRVHDRGSRRIQFAITSLYHFLFVPLTLGLAPLVAVMLEPLAGPSRSSVGS
jgi:hypothetical protein